MLKRQLSKLANSSPLMQALAIVSALVVLAGLFEAGYWLFGGKPKPHPKVVVAASPTPSPTPAAPEPTQTVTDTVQVPTSSMVATAKADLVSIVARTDPNAKAKVVARIQPHNLIGQETPFLLVGSQPGWYHALLPVRPNGTTGWISADQVDISEVGDYILANLTTYKLAHYLKGKLVDTFDMAIGVKETPTPTGVYYVWAIQPDPGPPYDPVILALSGFSPTLTNWPYGGIVGIHGWADPSVLGKQISNGCLRMRQADVKKLMTNLPLGTPVKIVP